MVVRVFLGLALFATALSLTGGGLSLPPFKNLGWLITPIRVDGLFGFCYRQPNEYMDFAKLNPDWQYHQENYCFNIFRPIGDGTWNLMALLTLAPISKASNQAISVLTIHS